MAVDRTTPASVSPNAQQRSASDPRIGRPHLLPNDLSGALKWLSDDELSALATGVEAEQQRRDPAKRSEIPPPRNHVAQRGAPDRNQPVAGLTKSQVSAIRASFKAGVKLSMIGRQFGVSQALVRSALAGPKG
jgi:hypothetical protein